MVKVKIRGPECAIEAGEGWSVGAATAVEAYIVPA